MKISTLKGLIIFMFFILFFDCVPPMRIKSTPPEPIIIIKEESASISFKRALLSIPPGMVIGGDYRGIANKKYVDYYWQTSISVASEIFNEIANKELINAGYKVIGTQGLLFDYDDSWQADCLLGAKITDIKFNTYSSVLEERAEGSISVQWELFDKNKGMVVFIKQTYGEETTEGKLGTECLFAAFRWAIRNLLSDRQFVHNLLIEKKLNEKSDYPRETILIEKVRLNNFTEVTEMINRAIESVVTIKSEHGFGSGVIISDYGYIITNFHVITKEHFIDVILFNGITLKAKVLVVNQDHDLVLLQIEGSGFRPLPISFSEKLPIGGEVFAIGTPANLNLSQSVTKGIISGIRKLKEREYIQTDVKVNPGNSGGPLINSNGEILGIVTVKTVGIEFEGLAFCIPINVVLEKLGIKIKS
jgi:serine protease Do